MQQIIKYRSNKRLDSLYKCHWRLNINQKKYKTFDKLHYSKWLLTHIECIEQHQYIKRSWLHKLCNYCLKDWQRFQWDRFTSKQFLRYSIHQNKHCNQMQLNHYKFDKQHCKECIVMQHNLQKFQQNSQQRKHKIESQRQRIVHFRNWLHKGNKYMKLRFE